MLLLHCHRSLPCLCSLLDHQALVKHSEDSDEEESFFPNIEKEAGVKGFMDNNVSQHGKFPLLMKAIPLLGK